MKHQKLSYMLFILLLLGIAMFGFPLYLYLLTVLL